MILSLYAFSLACFLLGIYPFTFYPLSLLVIRAAHKPIEPRIAENANPRPCISIALCAYNEERSIGAKIRNLATVSSAYPGESEILIYLDACTDRTADIVRTEAAAIGANFIVVEGTQRAGKSHGMSRLMADATGDIVIFTDANVELDKNCLDVAARVFTDAGIGCICGNLLYLNASDSATAEIGSLYWRFEEWLKEAESQTGSTVGADGSLFAIRRALFRPVPDDIIDDMFTSMGVLLQGQRVIRRDDFRAYEMHTVASRDEFRRKVRIACRSMNCYRLLVPHFRTLPLLTRYKIYAHKLLRWLTIYWLAVGVAALLCALLLEGAILPAAILAATGVALTAAAVLGVKSSILEILRAFIATGLGVAQSYRGERYQTWNIASSSRLG
ncbi:MAG TPA: glycosyltransferase [Rhizomicrobium sp.]|jgi:cellulose synthase/poly-beta-1,6-N-acetylglucosamine synthase-like glycosyltransferase|nr:glycosyltransferase [Rhizomicrobium sp.]